MSSSSDPHYICEAPPAAGELLSIDSIRPSTRGSKLASSISWIYMPLPFALDHVNLWLIGDQADGPLAVVDTGIQSENTQSIWQTLLQKTRKPTELLITHYHPDHIGLAGWLVNELGCPVITSQQEIDQARQAHASSDEEFSTGQAHWYRRHGLDEERAATVTRAGNTYHPIVSELPDEFTIVAHGDTLELGGLEWQVFTGGGHSSEQICLYNEALNILISADQVLPRITPNISLSWYKNEGDPLAVFLRSLDVFRDLPDDVLVLPSHGLPFTGLHPRIAYLREHHQERLERILANSREPVTATELMPTLFRRELDDRQLMFAMGECLAHLRLLTNTGQLLEETVNGVSHFRCAP